MIRLVNARWAWKRFTTELEHKDCTLLKTRFFKVNCNMKPRSPRQEVLQRTQDRHVAAIHQLGSSSFPLWEINKRTRINSLSILQISVVWKIALWWIRRNGGGVRVRTICSYWSGSSVWRSQVYMASNLSSGVSGFLRLGVPCATPGSPVGGDGRPGVISAALARSSKNLSNSESGGWREEEEAN